MGYRIVQIGSVRGSVNAISFPSARWQAEVLPENTALSLVDLRYYPFGRSMMRASLNTGEDLDVIPSDSQVNVRTQQRAMSRPEGFTATDQKDP